MKGNLASNLAFLKKQNSLKKNISFKFIYMRIHNRNTVIYWEKKVNTDQF